MTSAGAWLDQLTRESFVSVAVDEAASPPTEPATDPVPTTELLLHLETYRVRPDVNAVVHLHPQTTVLLDAYDEPIRLITTDHAFYLRRIARTPFAPPGTREVAAGAAAAVADGTNCVVLAHHGCSVLGETVAMAHRRAVNLEEAARLTYRALLLGRATADRRSRGRQSIPECPAEFLYQERHAV